MGRSRILTKSLKIVLLSRGWVHVVFKDRKKEARIEATASPRKLVSSVAHAVLLARSYKELMVNHQTKL